MTDARTLAAELRRALDDPKRYEWGDSPWEHLGDAERDVRVLLAELERQQAVTDAARDYLENEGSLLREPRWYKLYDALRALNEQP